MRIALINPLVDNKAIYGKFAKLGGSLPPLGLCYLAAVLEKAGHTVNILDANVLQSPNENVPSFLTEWEPELIGITATTLSFYTARDLAILIKNSYQKIPLVLGGPHVLGMEREVLQERSFDYVISGEGEETMLHLVETLAQENRSNLREALPRINGLAFKREDQVVVNPPRELMHNLDSLPFPARHLLPPLELYRPKAIQYKRLPATHIFTSRGCPYRCIFCRTSFGKEVRFHSPEYVISEIEHLIVEHGIREVIVNDDTFTIDPARVEKICEGMLQKEIDITWSCNIRANLVTKELLQKMRRAGCWQVMIGLESGSEEILKLLKKGATVAQGVQACQWAYEVGLEIRPTFILGNPTETLDTIESTIRLARSLPVHFPAFMLMTPFPGTEIWELADQYGAFDKTDFSALSVSSNASFVPVGLTAQLLKQKQKEAFRRVYFRPQMVWRHLSRVRNWQDISKLVHAFMSMIT